MVDFIDSTQLNKWLFTSAEELKICRQKANFEGRRFLEQNSTSTSESDATSASSQHLPVSHFAYGFNNELQKNPSSEQYLEGPLGNSKGHPYLTPDEEATLVSFYASKLPSLIGPKAGVSRLRRESKVTATAVLIYRRFFLSNSVMLFDPKVVMVAAAFLGAKAEDATADIRYLEEGTALMNAPVKQSEIIPMEISLLSAVHFDLLCFHPYKAVLALTEDLRTYAKSDKGQSLVTMPSDATDQLLRSKDLGPVYEAARNLVDDICVSDIPLLFSPGQVGLAALMVAQDDLLAKSSTPLPRINLEGYVAQRFDSDAAELLENLPKICTLLRDLAEGKHGCSHHKVDMQVLKGVHKKLKKVRVWGKTAKEKGKKRKGGDSEKGDPNHSVKKQKR